MKDEAKPLTPKLRFPEFRDGPDWRRQLLGDLFTQRQEIGLIDLPLLSLTDKDGIVPQEKTNRKDNSNVDKAKYLRVVPGDVAYNTMRMWEGRSAYVGLEGLVSPAYTVCKPKADAHGLFFSYYFKTSPLIVQFRRYSQGLVKDTLNLKFEAFAQIPIGSPQRPEQRKIADCLTSVDEWIAAEGRKLEALRAHKKGLMQQLFPREGETRPRLRFPEFRDAPEWGTAKLSTIFDLVSGVHLLPDEYGTEGEIPYFTGPSDFTNDVNAVPKWTSASLNVAKQGDTVITVKGSGVGELMFLDLPIVAMGRQLMAARPKNDSKRFILYLLETKRARFEDLASGNLIPGLSRGDILDVESPLPADKTEQLRIGVCLSSLDALIAELSRKLDGLRAHKKGLMQRLFPSPEGM